MTEISREARVLAAVMSLVDTLLADFDVVDLLTELTEQSAKLLDIDSAGLLLADPRRQLHLMAATSDRTYDLELFQLQTAEGPCLECFTTGQPITVADLDQDRQRWPRFVSSATEAGFASVHAVPMRAGGIVLGVLGLFGTVVGELDESDILVGQTLAHVASVAILHERSATPDTILRPLHAALNSRVVVDQATGNLRAHLEVPIEEAFGLLRRYAREHGLHLTNVARELVTDPDTGPTILADIAAMAQGKPEAPTRQ